MVLAICSTSLYEYPKLLFWCAEVRHLLFWCFLFFSFLLRTHDNQARRGLFWKSSWAVWWCSITTLFNYAFTEDPYLGPVKSYWAHLVCAYRAAHETAKLPFSPWQYNAMDSSLRTKPICCAYYYLLYNNITKFDSNMSAVGWFWVQRHFQIQW